MKTRNCYLLGFAIILVYMLPALIAGENHYLDIHEFLDSSMGHLKAMVDNGLVFDSEGTIPVLSGIPRNWYLADLKVLLSLIMPPFWAVILNLFLIKISAFAGMFLLLDRYVLRGSADGTKASFLAAILFAFVPFYIDYGISSAGVPLAAYCFLNLHENRYRFLSILGLVYYGVFSSLVLSGVFVCVCAALAMLIYMIRQRKFPLWPFIGLFILTVVYIGVNWQMFLTVLTNDIPTHRLEFRTTDSMLAGIGASLGTLFISQYHAGTCAAVVMVAAFIVLWRRRKGQNPMWDKLMTLLIALVSLMVFTGLVTVLFRDFKFVHVFQFDRFYFLYPALCYTLFAAVILTLIGENRRKALITLSTLVLLAGIGTDRFVTEEVCRLTAGGNHVGFRDFYDTELFARVKDDLKIDSKDVKVASLGMYPAVAEYNGMYTVDGYIQQYPLEYKHAFQKVIQGELDKDPALKEYFCDWGSRCYLFSSELGRHYMFGKHENRSVSSLDIDAVALAALGCRYILSAVDIENSESLGLQHAGTWEGAYWKIRAYRLPGCDNCKDE